MQMNIVDDDGVAMVDAADEYTTHKMPKAN